MTTTRLSDQLIIDELWPYGFKPTPTFCDQVRSYTELLLRWNQRISLTAVTTPVDILRFHFGESLFAISAARMRGGRLADVGSGAGFPGLPLAMAVPALDVTLIESNTKKAAFLGELRRELEMEKAHIFHGRTNALGPVEMFEHVSGRAVGKYAELLEWAKKRLTPGGSVLLWLGETQTREVLDNTGWKWREPVPIPQAKARFIVIGSPVT